MMKTIATTLLTLTLGAIYCTTQAQAQAQEIYPNKTVEILVGFTPGGVPDITARFLSVKLNEAWKQPHVGARFAPLGISPMTSSPDEFDRLIASEISAFNRLAKAANIKPE